ncbi:cytochrome c family protein, partial [Acidisphaera sp. L21]|uniref:c-type cytochrome n=1 Tax=Acidisphaera sp. L21 TaxID=1641851 RepID=UPI00131A8FAA
MDSLEFNKAVAAVLTAGIAFMVAGVIGDELVHPKKLETPAIKIDVPTADGAAAPVAAADPLVALLLASADPAQGEALVKQQGCVACHSFNEGGKAGIGPNLYGVVGAPHGHMVGYEYSAALKGKSGPWTYDELYEWLKKPSAYAPGTKMSYAGLTDPKKRADVIDYLHTLSHSPEALPPPPPVGAAMPVSASTAPAGVEPIAERLAAADPKAGQADTLKLGCI